MILAVRAVGVILLLVWLFCIAGMRRAMQMQGTLTHATVFQYCILPFIVGIELIVTGNLWGLALIPVAWILAIPFSSFCLFVSPLIFGWVVGTDLADWRGGLLGAILMLVVCSIVTAIVVSPKRAL